VVGCIVVEGLLETLLFSPKGDDDFLFTVTETRGDGKIDKSGGK